MSQFLDSNVTEPVRSAWSSFVCSERRLLPVTSRDPCEQFPSPRMRTTIRAMNAERTSASSVYRTHRRIAICVPVKERNTEADIQTDSETDVDQKALYRVTEEEEEAVWEMGFDWCNATSLQELLTRYRLWGVAVLWLPMRIDWRTDGRKEGRQKQRINNKKWQRQTDSETNRRTLTTRQALRKQKKETTSYLILLS